MQREPEGLPHFLLQLLNYLLLYTIGRTQDIHNQIRVEENCHGRETGKLCKRCSVLLASSCFSFWNYFIHKSINGACWIPPLAQQVQEAILTMTYQGNPLASLQTGRLPSRLIAIGSHGFHELVQPFFEAKQASGHHQ